MQRPPVLVGCSDCGGTVSQRAKVCPHCGSQFVPNDFVVYPSIPRIAMGVVLGYIGILVINVVLFFVVMVFFSAMMASVLSGVQQNPPPATRR